jgi:hypothetical protein
LGERGPYKAEVTGSIPVPPTNQDAALAATTFPLLAAGRFSRMAFLALCPGVGSDCQERVLHAPLWMRGAAYNVSTCSARDRARAVGELEKGQEIVIVVLPLDTIVRILDHAITTRRAPSPRANDAGAALSKSIIDALKKAKKDKANLVGPLEPGEYNTLSAWCRNVGLTEDGENVEAAVRASG